MQAHHAAEAATGEPSECSVNWTAENCDGNETSLEDRLSTGHRAGTHPGSRWGVCERRTGVNRSVVRQSREGADELRRPWPTEGLGSLTSPLGGDRETRPDRGRRRPAVRRRALRAKRQARPIVLAGWQGGGEVRQRQGRASLARQCQRRRYRRGRQGRCCRRRGRPSHAPRSDGVRYRPLQVEWAPRSILLGQRKAPVTAHWEARRRQGRRAR